MRYDEACLQAETVVFYAGLAVPWPIPYFDF
jgi:hypothetical protein